MEVPVMLAKKIIGAGAGNSAMMGERVLADLEKKAHRPIVVVA